MDRGEHDLLVARLDEQANALDNLTWFGAPLSSARVGHDAKRAQLIAAVGYLHKAAMARTERAKRAGQRFEWLFLVTFQAFVDQLDQSWFIPVADDHIN